MLDVQNLSAWYGAAQALFGVSLRVGAGEMVVLEGLNGAGKSTLLQSVIGLGPRTQGQVLFQGTPIESWPTHRRAQLGLGYVPEDRRLFADLSVLDNLRVAARVATPKDGQVPITVAQRQEQVLELFPALRAMIKRRAAEMSGGEQQMLSIARTLMTAPSLLLLDEPCEGIAPLLVESIRDALLALRKQGLALLIAEQNALLADHADRVITLVAGQLSEPVA